MVVPIGRSAFNWRTHALATAAHHSMAICAAVQPTTKKEENLHQEDHQKGSSLKQRGQSAFRVSWQADKLAGAFRVLLLSESASTIGGTVSGRQAVRQLLQIGVQVRMCVCLCMGYNLIRDDRPTDTSATGEACRHNSYYYSLAESISVFRRLTR